MHTILHNYNGQLLILSLLIALLSSYSYILILRRSLSLGGHSRLIGMITGGASLGLGLWSMHFIAMPILPGGPAQFQLAWIILSLFVAVAVGCASYLLACVRPSRSRFIGSGLLTGCGYGTMHIVAMQSLNVTFELSYKPDIIVLFILAASAGCTAELLFNIRPSENGETALRMPTTRGLLLGGSIFLLHIGIMDVTRIADRAAHPHGAPFLFDIIHAYTITMWVSIFAVFVIAVLLAVYYEEQRRIWSQARELEQRYMSLFENNRNMVFWLDNRGGIRQVNRAAVETLGYTAEQFAAEGFIRTILAAPGASGEWSRSGSGILEQRDTYDLRLRHRDGHEVELAVSNVPIVQQGRRIGHFVVAEDVTLQRETERALKRSEEQYKLITEHMSDLITLIDREGRLLYCSPSYEMVLGLKPEEIVGRSALEFVHPDDVSPVLERIRYVLETGKPATSEFRFFHRDGYHLVIDAQGEPILDEHGNVAKIIVSSRDATVRKHAEELIDHMAHHDALTGLLNRRAFHDKLSLCLQEAQRHHSKLGLLFVNLNRFKTINDSLGYAYGDMVLKEVAMRIQAVGGTAVLARLSGDEFTLLLPALSQAEEALPVAARIVSVLSDPIALDGQELHVTPSIGIAVYPVHAHEESLLIQYAHTALYVAKERGGDSIQMYSYELNERGMSLLELENGLRKALEREEFTLVYQPQVDLRTLNIVGVEALIRWCHPERGMISPLDFIPVAEETGLIHSLGEWVLRQACREIGGLRSEGYSIPRVAVNLSGVQFRDAGIVRLVGDVLREQQFPADRMELEITESMAMYKVEQVMEKLEAFKRMGLSLALDDFGTGYSSLGYLHRFPIDTLKIDKSFISTTEHSAIVGAVTAMAESLKMTVLAEGVEKPAQLQTLQELGCDYGQGYLFSKPLTLSELKEVLADHTRYGNISEVSSR
ncbi:EAL domain-containing protein [Paenibacillus chartarius]|uniref:EAL domain-containing protein n=1 Tax=Paenibacillus chartarius TaxID=747481 RepID=A0ABV6DM97_9BACL